MPQPARYAVHKLIVSTRRTQTAAKARKDIEQAMTLIRVLADDQPDELARVYQEARNRGEQWRQALTRGAHRMTPEVQDLLSEVVAESGTDA